MFLNKVYSIYDRNTKGKNIVIFFIIGFTLQFIIMGLLIPEFLRLSGNLPPFDLRMWYTTDDSMKLINALGDAGASFYLWRFLIVDLFFAFMLSSAIVMLLNLIMKKIEMPHIYIPVLIPFTGLLMDYTENLMTVLSIYIYPNTPSVVTYIGAVSTLLKQVLFMIAGLLLIIGTIRFIWIKAGKNKD